MNNREVVFRHYLGYGGVRDVAVKERRFGATLGVLPFEFRAGRTAHDATQEIVEIFVQLEVAVHLGLVHV